jgi:glycosyltransferase involved in cell wall biosynthesis
MNPRVDCLCCARLMLIHRLPRHMDVVLNTSELFRSHSGGIKTFTATLLVAIRQASFRSSVLANYAHTSPPKSSSSDLAYTDLFRIHEKIFFSSSRVGRLLGLWKQLALPRWLRRRSLPLTLISAKDPLYRQAQARIGGLIGNNPSLTSDQSEILVASRIYDQAALQFKRRRELTRLSLPSGMYNSQARKVVFHNPFPQPLILQGAHNVLTIHDLIPLTHPELCLDDPAYFYDLINSLSHQSTLIHVISQATKNAFLAVFGSRYESKIRVIPQPAPQPVVSDSILLEKAEAIYDHFVSTGEGIILQLGAIEPKKNHLTALDAFALVRQYYPRLKMNVIGRKGWLCDDLYAQLSTGSYHEVDYVGSLSKSSLQAALSSALLLIFPSIVEGWGLPPLEAMAAGTPVVASAAEACLEACGGAASHVHAISDPAAYASTAMALLSSKDDYMTHVQKGLNRCRELSQADYSNKMSSLYLSMTSSDDLMRLG